MVVVEIKGEIQVSTTCVVPNLQEGFSPKPPASGYRQLGRDRVGDRCRGTGRGGCVPGLCTGPVWYLGCRLSAIGCRQSAIGCRLGRRRRRVPPGGTSDPAPGTRHDEVWTDDESILLRAVRSFVRSFRVLTPGSRLPSPFLVSFSFFLHVPATTTRSLGTTPFYEHDLNLSLSTTR